ncbi:hypothetical protein [Thiosulfativibrio zosterae]|uniref:Phage abortive infection protein n=1 Tax=Thiosulfativibrio zosterae TaxID=2675053 RepID=A0A6F8PN27_9GAMM|nr:hypothetical protein [Thiosulfativibrio zosterae]BBP43523.1 hypothetical protein THMIRHAT_12690 [Thiosulfativibrio zosterae]
MKLKVQFTNFWVALLLFTAAIFVIFFVVLHTWESIAGFLGLLDINFVESKENIKGNIVVDPGKFLDSISNSLGLIIGAPVALAGSAVAIILAQRALAVSERQEYSDNINLIDEKVSELKELIWSLSKAYREFSNNAQKLTISYHNYYLLFKDDEPERKNFLDLSKKVENSQKEFIDCFLKAVKNPTINEYIKDTKYSLFINQFIETVYKNNSCERSTWGEQELYQIPDLAELALKLEFAFCADDYEKMLDDYFSEVKTAMLIGQGSLEGWDKVYFGYYTSGFHFFKDKSSYDFNERIKASIINYSPEKFFMEGALFNKQEYFLSRFRDEPLLSLDGSVYYPYSEFVKLDFYDPDESYVWDEMEGVVSDLNLGSAFILELVNFLKIDNEKLKELFIKGNHLFFTQENKLLRELVDREFSTIQLTSLLPKRVFDYLDFIKHYQMFNFADSKFVGFYEIFDYIELIKKEQDVWPDDLETITSEQVKLLELIFVRKKRNIPNESGPTDFVQEDDFPFF